MKVAPVRVQVFEIEELALVVDEMRPRMPGRDMQFDDAVAWYPEGDDDQKLASLVSADHPDIADRYRHGHAMLESVDGASSTENLRKAMLDFRAVLEDVLQGERTAA